MNMNGGKTGNGKKSNAHLNTGYNQLIKSNASSGQNTMTGFGVGVNINLYKQTSNGTSGTINNNSGPSTSAMKDSIAFSNRINQKMKKRQMNQAQSISGIACNTNPARGESIKAINERDGSVDATSSYNNNGGTIRALG